MTAAAATGGRTVLIYGVIIIHLQVNIGLGSGMMYVCEYSNSVCELWAHITFKEDRKKGSKCCVVQVDYRFYLMEILFLCL